MHHSPSAGPAARVPTPDGFPYGWRYVNRRQPDGTTTVEQVPLTLDEALHPQEGDQVPESSRHVRWRDYLAGALESHLAADPAVVVLSDVIVRWDHPLVRPTSPDVTVLRGVRERREDWSSFDVAAEGAEPVLVMEITSPSTADGDRQTKFREYELVGIPSYVIVDAAADDGAGPIPLAVYRLGDGGYEALAPDERGRWWLEPVGLWLAMEDRQPRLYDPAGRPLLYRQEMVAAQQEMVAAQAEAEARIRELEAALRRLRGD
jgi:Uma2 family endonuclease